MLRLLVDGHFVTDEFFNGRPFEFGLARHLAGRAKAELRLQILPFDPRAPIYLEKRDEVLGDGRPAPGTNKEAPVLSLDFIELLPRQRIKLNW